MNVLQNERKLFLASIFVSRLADGARGRVGPKRLVICPAIVITGESKSARGPQYQDRRRDRLDQKPGGKPRRPQAQPSMAGKCLTRRLPDKRTVHRRQVWPERIVLTLK